MASKRRKSKHKKRSSSKVETYMLTAGKPHRDCPICRALGLAQNDDEDGVWLSFYDPESKEGEQIVQAMSSVAFGDPGENRRN